MSDRERPVPQLDKFCTAVYQLALDHGYLDPDVVPQMTGLPRLQVEQTLRKLLSLHLLRPIGSVDSRLVPVSPEAAVAQLITPLEAEIRSYKEAAEQIRSDLSSLLPLYFERRQLRRPREAVDILDDAPTVVSVLARMAAQCKKEVMTIQPGGGRPSHILKEAVDRDRAMLARGVRMRVLYQHTARFSFPTQQYVSTIEEIGGEVRTVGELFGRMIIFDREAAFIPAHTGKDGAVLTREPSIVETLCGVFDQLWHGADPFTEPLADDLDDTKRTILQMLIEGNKDELIARRIGVSVRTCRRHIAELLQGMGANSRFQGGYLAASTGALTPSPRQTETQK